jgi:hypothetical protein
MFQSFFKKLQFFPHLDYTSTSGCVTYGHSSFFLCSKWNRNVHVLSPKDSCKLEVKGILLAGLQPVWHYFGRLHSSSHNFVNVIRLIFLRCLENVAEHISSSLQMPEHTQHCWANTSHGWEEIFRV